MTPVARVLIVDHDQRFLESVTEILSLEGVEVVCVSRPEDVALTLASTPAFDAIVADLASPYFGSPQFCQNMMNRYPLVVVSSSEDCNLLARYSWLCDCVLPKQNIGKNLFKATLKAIERHQLGLQQAA